MSITIPTHLSNDELMAAAPRLSGDERGVTARLVAHLAEIDARGLYVAAGYSCLYVYCHEGLGYSEDAAYNRKAAAQVARRYPAILDMLADGRLNLTVVRLLAPVINDANWEATVAEAAGKSKREVEKLVVRLEPKPDVPSTVRKLPGRSAAVPERPKPPEGPAGLVPQGTALLTEPASPSRVGKRPEVAPLAPERYRVQFTIGEETERKLRRLQSLLKREIPDGDPAVIFDRAVTLLLEKVESRKNGLTARPRAAWQAARGSRHMPAATRRAVTRRDGGQCAFVAPDGRRCTARVFLEYHHAKVPYGHGGEATAGNIALHCRAHNAHEALRVFGRWLPPEVREARAAYEWPSAAVPERRADVELRSSWGVNAN
jgi:hypothetical protein